MNEKSVLIIDDEEDFANLLREFFKVSGYEVETAHNLEEAVSVFKKRRPRVVLLDFKMPVVTGEQLLPLLQSVDPRVRAIVITGYPEEDVEEKFKGFGYFAFFEKNNLSLEALRKKVDEAIDY